jgi:hypothetical protein
MPRRPVLATGAPWPEPGGRVCDPPLHHQASCLLVPLVSWWLRLLYSLITPRLRAAWSSMPTTKAAPMFQVAKAAVASMT